MIVKVSAREKIAEAIHEGWMGMMEKKGYRYDVVRDDILKGHPHMIPWDKMSDEDKVSTYVSADAVVRLLQREDVYV